MGEDPEVSVRQDAAQIGKMARTPEKCRCAGQGMRGRNRDSCFSSHRLLSAGTRYSRCLPAHKQRLEKAKNHSRYTGKTPGDQSPGSCLPPSLSPFLGLKGVPQQCQESSFKAGAGRCTFDSRSDPLCTLRFFEGNLSRTAWQSPASPSHSTHSRPTGTPHSCP